jgi:hypothetical protein
VSTPKVNDSTREYLNNSEEYEILNNELNETVIRMVNKIKKDNKSAKVIVLKNKINKKLKRTYIST